MAPDNACEMVVLELVPEVDLVRRIGIPLLGVSEDVVDCGEEGQQLASFGGERLRVHHENLSLPVVVWPVHALVWTKPKRLDAERHGERAADVKVHRDLNAEVRPPWHDCRRPGLGWNARLLRLK